MAIKVNSNFEFQSKTYGDAKAHFSTIAEMAAYNVNLIPNGFITFVDEENANYQWLDINEDDPTTGKWRKFSAADGLVDDTLVTSSTHTYSIDKIKALINVCGGITLVDALPNLETEDGRASVDLQKIYLVPNPSATDGNIKEEYVCVYIKGAEEVKRTALVTQESDYNTWKAELQNYVIGGGTLTDDYATFSATNTSSTMTADTYADMVESLNASDADFAAYTARVTAEVITPAIEEKWYWELIGSISTSNLVFDEFTPNNAIGKVKAGVSLKDADIIQVLKNMLTKDIAPTIALTTTPVDTTLNEKGTTVTDVTVSANITVGTAEFAAGANVIFKKDGVAISTQPFAVDTLAYTYTDTGANLTDNTTYSVELEYTLAENAATLTDSKIIKFALPMYYGISATDTVADVTTLTKIVSDKGSQNVTYTADNEYCVFAVPSTKSITSLKDVNGFENVDSWATSTQSVTVGADSVEYKVYVTNTPVTCSNFVYTVKLS